MSLNWYGTGTASGMFYNKDTTGYVQGESTRNPNMLYKSKAAYNNDTQILWAGCGVVATFPASGQQSAGLPVVHAPSVTSGNSGINAFVIGDNLYASVIFPNGSTSPSLGSAPYVAPKNGLSIAPVGSGIELALQVDSTLAATLASGGSMTQTLSWDPVNQKLVAATANNVISVTILGFEPNSFIMTYDSTNAVVNWSLGPAALVRV